MIRTNQQAQRAIVSVFYLFALLWSPTNAHALSCKPRNFTLNDAYAAADSIIVGVITECEEEVSSDLWTNGGRDCSFSAVEVLKESVPTRDYSGVTSSSGCGLSLQVGSQYLLFLDGTNQPMRFSATLSGDPQQTQLANSYVQIIRDFRNQIIGDLAEPWIFVGSDDGCSIWQSVRGNRITFSRRTGDAPQQAQLNWTRESRNGETVYTTETPLFDAEMRKTTGSAEIVAFGDIPNYADDALMLSVHLQEASTAPARHATLSVGSKTWPLNRFETNLSFPGAPEAITVINYHASGSVVEQILSTIAVPAEIVVSATAIVSDTDPEGPDATQPDQGSFAGVPSSNGNFGRASPETGSMILSDSSAAQKELPQTVIRVESRSTQLSGVLKSFRTCEAED